MKRIVLALSILCAVSGCVTETRYTLYRTNVDTTAKKEDPIQRLYVATFDVPRSGVEDQALINYNNVNCKYAEKLFNAEQPHLKGSVYERIKLFYWCEEGGYRP